MLPIIGQEIFSFGFRGGEIAVSSCIDSGFKSQTFPPMRQLTRAWGGTSQQRLRPPFERPSFGPIDIS